MLWPHATIYWLFHYKNIMRCRLIYISVDQPCVNAAHSLTFAELCFCHTGILCLKRNLWQFWDLGAPGPLVKVRGAKSNSETGLVRYWNVHHSIVMVCCAYRYFSLSKCFSASKSKWSVSCWSRWGVFRARLFRDSCVFHRGNYVKDLNSLGRDLRRVVIVDNSPASYIFHPDNAVSIPHYLLYANKIVTCHHTTFHRNRYDHINKLIILTHDAILLVVTLSVFITI